MNDTTPPATSLHPQEIIMVIYMTLIMTPSIQHEDWRLGEGKQKCTREDLHQV